MSERLMGWFNNTLEPKRTNRYELLLEDDLRLTCKSVSFPKITVEGVDIHRMHNIFKVAGSKVTYNDISLTFYDYVDNKAARKLDDWFKQVYNINTSLMGFPAQYKRNITLLMYGPDHSLIESWLLVGAFPKEISKKDLSWESKDPIDISVSLSIDEAKLILSA